MFSPYTAIAAKKELLEEISRLRGDVETDYYTSTEVDTLIDGVIAGSVDLTNYYTKAEVDQLFIDYDPGTGGSVDLTDYYTKTEVDNLDTELLLKSVSLAQHHTTVVNNISRGVANLVEQNGWFDMSTLNGANEATLNSLLVNTEIWVSGNKGYTGVKMNPGYIYGQVDRRLIDGTADGDFGMKQYDSFVGFGGGTYPSSIKDYTEVYGGDFEVSIAIIINGQPVDLYKDGVGVSPSDPLVGSGKTIPKNGVVTGQHFIGLTMGSVPSIGSSSTTAYFNGLASTYSDQVINPGVFTYNVPTPKGSTFTYIDLFPSDQLGMLIYFVKSAEDVPSGGFDTITLNYTNDLGVDHVVVASGRYDIMS